MKKYCPNCGSELTEGAKYCDNCGAALVQQPVQQIQPQQYAPVTQPGKHTGFGTAGLVLGIIAVIMSATIILGVIGLILGILAIIFGAIAFWGKSRDKYGLAGFICGLIAVILYVIWIVIAIIGISLL